MTMAPHSASRQAAWTGIVLMLLAWVLPLPSSADFAEDCQALAQAPHRLAGTTSARAAGDYLIERLEQLGVDAVVTQPFRVPQTVVKGCVLRLPADGDRQATEFKLHPMRPNGLVAPTTPPSGITGPLRHGGQGDVGDFGEAPLTGALVVLDYNCGDGWRRAFRLGAKAVIFTRESPLAAHQRHHVEADVNLPRFYYDGPAAELTEVPRATLTSSVTWEGRTARNIFGLIRGKQATLQLGQEEIVILAAPYDSFGEVPTLSKGARGAANCAALLAIGEALVRARPDRHVLLAFLDNEARGHAGSAALYGALEDDFRSQRLAVRREAHENEVEFVDRILAAFAADGDPLAPTSPVRKALQLRLRDQAAERAHDVNDRIVTRRKALTKDGKEALGDTAIKALQEQKDTWNEVRRWLAHLDAPLPENCNEQVAIILTDVRQHLEQRRAELVLASQRLEAEQRLQDLLKDYWISLHLTLKLGDGGSRWALVIGGSSSWHNPKDNPGLYGKIQSTFVTAHEKAARSATPAPGFEVRSADGSLSPTTLFWAPGALTHGGEMAGRYGIWNAVLCTTQDRQPREGTPDDTLAALAPAAIARQAADIAALLPFLLAENGLSLRRSIEADRTFVNSGCTSAELGRIEGPRVMAKTRGSSIPNKPTPGAVVRLWCGSPLPDARALDIPGFDNFHLLRTDRNGSYSYGPLPTDPYHYLNRAFAAVFDPQGQVRYASTASTEHTPHTRLNIFQARSGVVMTTPQFRLAPANIMRALANAPLGWTESYTATRDGLIYWYCEEKVDGIKIFGTSSAVLLMNGQMPLTGKAETVGPEGDGRSLLVDWTLPNISPRSGADIWRLNESRLETLRARGVVNTSVEALHGRSEDLLLDAAQTPGVAEREALAASAFLIQKRVYNSVRATLDDLVKAVLILLALSIPFSFALERLLIGATTIYKRLVGFVIFFLVTFLVLYLSHPAFAISATPIIIFLGFAILALSLLVIVVIMGKFESELKVLQGMQSTVHAADVSRLSTVIAAMNMGISTMRRRPLRTALTAITIILLTFTILCFASFDTKLGVLRLFAAPSPEYAGVFVHGINWEPLGGDLLAVAEGRWHRDATVAERVWLSPRANTEAALLLSSRDGTAATGIRGLLGIDPGELSFRPDLQQAFGRDPQAFDGGIWLTEGSAEAVGAAIGDTVLLSGIALTVRGRLDPAALAVMQDMDASSLLPVDFGATASNVQTTQAEMEQAMNMGDQNWAYLPVDSVGFVSAETATQLGGAIVAISLYTKTTDDALLIAEELARMAPLPVAATRADGVFYHFLGRMVAASGVKDLVFPLLLGGLVIFGTMLGSVADREKEIYTFSALGLAPPHVASLFFAEAMVYAVIGGLAGYLLAQGSMKFLIFLAGYGLIRVPELNYSSMNAIVTIVVVMLTVLVSALYPALKASRSANPGILRNWRVPAPQGDRLQLVFPFTVSSYDITGVVSFLHEHFDNYADSGMGTFIARNTALIPPNKEGDDVGLRADLALAPYDLGVTQAFELHSTPSEIPGIDEVRIDITRRSGQPKDWQRLNKVLLDDLRRQFLIWRSLPHETMDLYRSRTLRQYGMHLAPK